MKKLIPLIAVLIIIVNIFSKCKKESAVPDPSTTLPPDTELQISIKDNNGNAVYGATATLYLNLTDLEKQINGVATTLSDASGNALFTGLSSIKYYFFVKSGCENNFNSSVVLVNPLPLNVKSNVSTVVASAGTLAFTNNSTNPYAVYVNGTYAGLLNGGDATTVPYQPSGNYSIQVIQ